MEVVEFDFREGGGYYFRYTWGEQPLRGKFLTIEPEKSLVFTWLLQPPDLDAGNETLVSVWFRPGPTAKQKSKCCMRSFLMN